MKSAMENVHCDRPEQAEKRRNNYYFTIMCTSVSFILKKRCATIASILQA
jgi:hypothetical protein